MEDLISKPRAAGALRRVVWRALSLEAHGPHPGGLVPAPATPTGQETFFHRAQICPRVEQILQRGETSLEELAEKLRNRSGRPQKTGSS